MKLKRLLSSNSPLHVPYVILHVACLRYMELSTPTTMENAKTPLEKLSFFCVFLHHYKIGLTHSKIPW